MPVIQTTPKISCHHRDATSANACGGRIRAGLLDRFWQCDKCYWEEQEAPQKAQQVWFINQLGANVNLGNIAPAEVIPLETLRLGVRGDTFFNYLPQGINVNEVLAKSKKKV